MVGTSVAKPLVAEPAPQANVYLSWVPVAVFVHSRVASAVNVIPEFGFLFCVNVLHLPVPSQVIGAVDWYSTLYQKNPLPNGAEL